MIRLTDFLKNKNVQTGSGQPHTHTRIPNKSRKTYGGIFNIESDADVQKFHRLYIDAMFPDTSPDVKPECIAHLTEKQLDKKAPILIDMDLKYDSSKIQKRQHNSSTITNILEVYLNTLLREFVDVETVRKDYDNVVIPIYVMEKDEMVLDPQNPEKLKVQLNVDPSKPDVAKDGIHIIIGLALNRSEQVHLRKKVIETLKHKNTLKDLPLLNSIDDVFDDAVTSGNSNWQLYGSRKPNCQPYKLTYHFEANAKTAIVGDDVNHFVWNFETKYSRTIQLVRTTDNNTNCCQNQINDLEDAYDPNNSDYDYVPSDVEDDILSDIDDDHTDDENDENNENNTAKNRSDIEYHYLENGSFDITEHFEKMSARYKHHMELPMRVRLSEPERTRPHVLNPNLTSASGSDSASTSTHASGPLIRPFYLQSMNEALGTIHSLDDINSVCDKLLEIYHEKKNTHSYLFKTGVQQQPIDLQEVHDFTMALPPSYYEMGRGTYNAWIKVGWALKNTSHDLFPFWLKMSAKASGFTMDDVHNMHRTWVRSQPSSTKEPLTYKSIRYWCYQDNPVEARRIQDSSVDNFIVKTLAVNKYNETDVTTVLYQMYKDRFRCADIKSGKWYMFNNHRWEENDSGTALRSMLTTDLCSKFQMIQKKLNLEHASSLDGDDAEGNNNANKNVQTGLASLLHEIMRTANKRNIMHEACHMFKEDKFEENLNRNVYLIGFENGVYDFNEKQFRKGKPDDYITMSTRKSYLPIDRTNEDDVRILKEIETFFEQLFPNKELCKYMWEHLASTLIGTVLQETINIYMGSGRNGKSKLTELMKMTLGDYYGDVPVALVTQKRGKVGGTSSEVAQLKSVRYAVMQEPSKGDIINDGVLKQLTGGDQINARELYCKAESFLPQFKLVMATNNLPAIGSTDDGIWRRVRVCKFESKFTEVPYRDETEEQRKYQFPVDKEIKEKFEIWSNVFIARLIEIAVETRGHVTDCSVVTEESSKYRNDQDVMSEFFKAHVVRDTSARPLSIKKSDLSEVFKIWYIRNRGRNPPPGKELFDFMDERCGKNIKGSWKGFRLLWNEGDADQVDQCD